MSEIPPDIAASAAQAAFQAGEVTKEREAHHAGQVHAAGRQVKTVNDAGTTVETSDADTAVFSDAEGQGSQGRSLHEESSVPPTDEPEASGVTTDEHGRFHVDVQA